MRNMGIILLLAFTTTSCAFQAPGVQWVGGDATVSKICEAEICETTTEGGTISELFRDTIGAFVDSAVMLVAMFYGGDEEQAMDAASDD